MKFDNYMILEFPSKSCNEAFARSAVACFAAQLDPTMEELGDIRTAVSEAVTNCIVHAYPEALGLITLRCRILKDNVLDIVNPKNLRNYFRTLATNGKIRRILSDELLSLMEAAKKTQLALDSQKESLSVPAPEAQ